MRNTGVIMNDLMNNLIDTFGIVETEIFISTLIREPFDYTKWQSDQFDNQTLDEFNSAAVKFSKTNPIG